MAISINRLTSVITIPQADCTLISGTLYELDTEAFRDALKVLEASEEGIVFDDTHIHNTEVTVVGVTYARFIEMISPYSVTFTPDSQWSVRLAGSNNNLFDIENGILNQNQVQVIGQNAAGLIVHTSGSGLSAGEQAQLAEIHKIHGLLEGSPMTVTPTSRVAGDVEQTISGDGETTTTVTRDP
jgi:hypothetical protein